MSQPYSAFTRAPRKEVQSNFSLKAAQSNNQVHREIQMENGKTEQRHESNE